MTICNRWWKIGGLAALLAILLLGTPWSLPAQQADPAADAEAEDEGTPTTGRFHFGLRIMALLTPLQRQISETAFDSGATPALATQTYSNNAKHRLGGGATIQVNITPKISVNVDYLYRRFGYDSGVVVTTQAAGSSSGAPISASYQRTRADLWDVPVTMRYYAGPAQNLAGKRLFLSGGATMRRVTGLESFNEQINSSGISNSNTTPAPILNKSTAGITAGLGLQMRRASRNRIDMELRYTRWMKQIFDYPTARTNPHQMELAIGLLF